MKRVACKIATLAVLALLPGIAVAQTPKEPTSTSHSITVWSTRRTVMDAFEYIYIPDSNSVLVRVDRSSVRFTPSGFEFDAMNYGGGKTHYSVDLKTLESTVKGFWGSDALLENDGGKPLKKFKEGKGKPPKDFVGLFVSESEAGKVIGKISWGNPGSGVYTGDCVHAMESFISAINQLRAYAVAKASAVSEFPQQAAAWRALLPKPPLPEEVRAQRILAENAVKEKQLIKAMIHYETGLNLYPTWPQGYFNAALIAAELGAYAEAVQYMQAYLELVPEASDAQAARDQIVIWGDKATQPATSK